MAATITVPGIGPVKKPYLFAGIGITAGIIGFAYYRRRTAPADTGTSATAAAASPDTTGTGDYVQSSDAAGYNTVYPPTPAQYSPYGYDIYGNPLPAPTGATGSAGTYTTNADWATAAENALENGGVSLAVSTLAISRVLGGLTVTSAQRDYFLQAVGLLGQPPQGYPQPIKLTDTGTGPPKPPPGSPLPAPSGLKVTSVGRSTVSLSWKPVAGATHYRIYRSDLKENVGDSIDTKAPVGGLLHNHTYHFHVRALSANGVLGAASHSVTARTKK